MVLKLSDSSHTADAIAAATNNVTINGQLISGTATAKMAGADRIISLQLNASSGHWPDDVRVATIAFRPAKAGYYFNYIDFGPEGSVVRITRESATEVTMRCQGEEVQLHFRTPLATGLPCQLGIFLVDGKGNRYLVGFPPIPVAH